MLLLILFLACGDKEQDTSVEETTVTDTSEDTAQRQDTAE